MTGISSNFSHYNYQNYNFDCCPPEPMLAPMPSPLGYPAPQDTFGHYPTMGPGEIYDPRILCRPPEGERDGIADEVKTVTEWAETGGSGRGIIKNLHSGEYLDKFDNFRKSEKFVKAADKFSVLKKTDKAGDLLKSMKGAKALKTGAKFLKPFKVVGELAQVAVTAAEVYDVRKDTSLTASEKDQKVGESVVKGGASMLGGIAGGAIGAAIGGAVGSLIPGPGTAIGGFIGGVVGGWIGDTVGEKIGEAIGKTEVGKVVGSVTNAGIDAVFGKSVCAEEKAPAEKLPTVSVPMPLVNGPSGPDPSNYPVIPTWNFPRITRNDIDPLGVGTGGVPLRLPQVEPWMVSTGGQFEDNLSSVVL